jgi:hypothetical protein
MGNNIKTGSKSPKSLDYMKPNSVLPPLPKMYQMGIAKGVEQERERIVGLLESLSECKAEPAHDDNGDCYCDTVALIRAGNK